MYFPTYNKVVVHGRATQSKLPFKQQLKKEFMSNNFIRINFRNISIYVVSKIAIWMSMAQTFVGVPLWKIFGGLGPGGKSKIFH